MNARELATEFNESLQSAARELFQSDEWVLYGTGGAEAAVRQMLEACANNLAAGYADRTVTDDEANAMAEAIAESGKIFAEMRR